jgi:hypothetical protein
VAKITTKIRSKKSASKGETDERVIYHSHLFSIKDGEWVRSFKTAYPFIKYFPIAIVTSISQFSGCATIPRKKTETRVTVFNLLVRHFG